VDEIPLLGRDDEGQMLKQLTAQYGAPAYVRRAQAVAEALDRLLDRCRRKRDEWSMMVRLQVGILRELAGGWERLRPWLVDEEQLRVLERLHAELAPRLRLPVEPASSDRVLRRALVELRDGVERFNRRWHAYLPTVDRAPVNELRDGYNRYYVLEKECAVRSAPVARQGFRRLEPLTVDELAALLPPLPVPRLNEG
jgi:hypothetical protein